jgi:hypothetical protein
MKFMDDDRFGWALVVVTLFLIGAQVVRAVANTLWG